jgi:hypothetical protein
MNVAHEIEVGEIIRRRWWSGFGSGVILGLAISFLFYAICR